MAIDHLEGGTYRARAARIAEEVPRLGRRILHDHEGQAAPPSLRRMTSSNERSCRHRPTGCQDSPANKASGISGSAQ
jgi:hypothetical protein